MIPHTPREASRAARTAMERSSQRRDQIYIFIHFLIKKCIMKNENFEFENFRTLMGGTGPEPSLDKISDRMNALSVESKSPKSPSRQGVNLKF